jgi:hypothetical protein
LVVAIGVPPLKPVVRSVLRLSSRWRTLPPLREASMTLIVTLDSIGRADPHLVRLRWRDFCAHAHLGGMRHSERVTISSTSASLSSIGFPRMLLAC